MLRELLTLPFPDLRDMEQPYKILMQEGVGAATAMAGHLFSGPPPAEAEDDPHRHLLSKCWERLLQIVVVTMERHPLDFAPFVPQWITLCVNTALLGMDAAAVQHIR